MPTVLPTMPKTRRKKIIPTAVLHDVAPCSYDAPDIVRIVVGKKVERECKISDIIQYQVDVKPSFAYNGQPAHIDIFLGLNNSGEKVFVNDIIEYGGNLYQIFHNTLRGAYGVCVNGDTYSTWIICNDVMNSKVITNIYNYDDFVSQFKLPEEIVKKIRIQEI